MQQGQARAAIEEYRRAVAADHPGVSQLLTTQLRRYAMTFRRS